MKPLQGCGLHAAGSRWFQPCHLLGETYCIIRAMGIKHLSFSVPWDWQNLWVMVMTLKASLWLLTGAMNTECYVLSM